MTSHNNILTQLFNCLPTRTRVAIFHVYERNKENILNVWNWQIKKKEKIKKRKNEENKGGKEKRKIKKERRKRKKRKKERKKRKKENKRKIRKKERK